MSDYNGWTNYETWKLALNINNDEGMQETVFDFIRQNKNCTVFEFRDWIEEFISDCNTEEIKKIGYKLSDFWSFNEWNEINFSEILETFKQNVEEVDNYKEDD